MIGLSILLLLVDVMSTPTPAETTTTWAFANAVAENKTAGSESVPPKKLPIYAKIARVFPDERVVLPDISIPLFRKIYGNCRVLSVDPSTHADFDIHVSCPIERQAMFPKIIPENFYEVNLVDGRVVSVGMRFVRRQSATESGSKLRAP